MTQKNRSLKFVIVKNMMFFVGITLVFFIVCQGYFFKTSYKNRVFNTIETASNDLENSYLNDTTEEYKNKVMDYAIQSNVYSYLCDSDFREIHNQFGGNFQNFVKPNEIRIMYEELLKSGNNEIVKEIKDESMVIDITKIVDDGTIYYLVVYTEVIPIDNVIYALNFELYMVILFMLVMSLFIGYVVTKNVSDPLKQLEKQARNISNGNTNIKFDVRGYEEVESLSRTLNYATAEINKTTALQQNLIANVSHDLRTPLTLIKAYAEMIRDISGNNPEKRNSNLEIIIKETDRLTGLVNDLLELSKLQQDFDLKISEFDLSKTLYDVIELFKILEENDYKFILNIKDSVIIQADESKLKQVIYNLISNAVNYTGENKEVHINLLEEEKRYVFEVIDTGKGIEESKISTIWERYYRDENNHIRSVVGTGLGLSIVKKILIKHDFEFGVKSKVNEGSNFYFYVIKKDKMS